MKFNTLFKISLMLCLCCTLFTNAQKPDFNWVGKIGRTDKSSSTSITADRLGNVYTVGVNDDTGDFDPGPGVFKLPNMPGGFQNMFITKTDPLGRLIWAKCFGNNSYYNVPNIITSDSTGNIYMAGRFGGTADLAPGVPVASFTSSGGTNPDMFICKMDSSANLIWIRTFGSTGLDEAFALTTDKNGNVFTTGRFSGITDFDPGAAVYSLTAINSEIFISKLNTNGNFVWAKSMGGINNDIAYGIALDDSANVYTTGTFENKADFDPSAATVYLTDKGSRDAFISKLDSNGNFVWVKQLSASDGETGRRIVCDKSGDIIIAGFSNNDMDFDPGAGTYFLKLSHKGSSNYFLLKLNRNGNFAWAGLLGHNSYGSTGVENLDIALDSADNIYVTAFYGDSSDFDPDTLKVYELNTKGGRVAYPSGLITYDDDIFIARINKDGSFGWARGIGGRNYDKGSAICLDDSGAIYSTGTFSDTVDFDPGPDSTSIIAGPPYAPFVTTHAGSYILKMSPCLTTDSTLTISACNSYILNAVNYTISGTYTQKLLNSTGCDSFITLKLTIDKVNKNLTVIATDIRADETGASAYQWLDCDKGKVPIPGATSRIYTPLSSGHYAVALTKGVCIDTSLCTNFIPLGIENYQAESTHYYPNPTSGILDIDFEVSYPYTLLTITNLMGVVVQKTEVINSKKTRLNLEVPKGFYLISIDHGDGQKQIIKVMKN